MPQTTTPNAVPLYVHESDYRDRGATQALDPIRMTRRDAEERGYWPVYPEFDARVKRMAVWNGWAGQWYLCAYAGDCVGCGRRTYLERNGHNDPRGMLGDSAGDPMNPREHGRDDAPEGEVPACFLCGNDTSERYQQLIDTAIRVLSGDGYRAGPVGRYGERG